MNSQRPMMAILCTATLSIASCGGKNDKKPTGPAPVVAEQNQSPVESTTRPSDDAAPATPTQPESPSGEQSQTPGDASDSSSSSDPSGPNGPSGDNSQDETLADPTRTDFEVNKSCDASKVKPSQDLPIEIKIKACVHLRTDNTKADAVTQACGEKDSNIKDGNVCAKIDGVKSLCRLLGRDYVLDYYPTDGSDWDQFCTLVGGETIEL